MDPRVLEAMLPHFGDSFGNASSKSHPFGWAAAEAVERARGQVAQLIGAASPEEIVFTSGATEADNLAIKGLCDVPRPGRDHIVTCVTEHPAVLDCCRALAARGWRLTEVPVDAMGQIDLDALDGAATENTALIAVMAVNNEIGTLHPLRAIGELARSRGIPWHCDAAQAAGKVPLDVAESGMDLLAVSGHKIYGPKGVGALYVARRRPRLRLVAQQIGGGQERGLRPGTLNVPGIVGLGMACEISTRELPEESARIRGLRLGLAESLLREVPGAVLNGHPSEGAPGCLNVALGEVDGAALITALRDVALSSGSACASGSGEPSPVLAALGRTNLQAFASVRFGIGRFNTQDELDRVATRVIDEVRRLEHN